MDNQQTDVQFEDMESHSGSFGKEDITIRGIVLNHVKKICQLSCEEFIGGYFNSVTEFHNGLKYTPGKTQDEKLKCARDMFKELNKLLHRRDYLSE